MASGFGDQRQTAVMSFLWDAAGNPAPAPLGAAPELFVPTPAAWGGRAQTGHVGATRHRGKAAAPWGWGDWVSQSQSSAANAGGQAEQREQRAVEVWCLEGGGGGRTGRRGGGSGERPLSGLWSPPTIHPRWAARRWAPSWVLKANIYGILTAHQAPLLGPVSS